MDRLRPGEEEAAARLIHGALNAWYRQRLNQPERFGPDHQPFRAFAEVYEALDPGCAVVLRGADGGLTGICFYHPRPTHVSVGIVAVSPETGGKGAARRMVEEVLALADREGKPLRLVSSLMNLDSFSLYTRMGFVPRTVFQDMQFPAGILPPPVPGEKALRPATMRDIEAMAALEKEISGIDRRQDFEFFLQPGTDDWQVLLKENPDGKLEGFLVAFCRPGMSMLGPGVMDTGETAEALIAGQLRLRAPENPVFLVPVQEARLVASLYAAGARNVELHAAQVRGPGQDPRGVVMPTFLPESG